MPVDMKKIIAEAAKTLLIKKGVRKLTVKDIVEECHITRQSFYYHFEDIPALFRWVLEQEAEQFMQEARGQKQFEENLRYFFLVAINVSPHVKKTMQSNYGDEIERLIEQQIYRMFEQMAEEAGLYRDYSQFELKLILRYHSQAIIGILRGWSEEDTKNLDSIVHEIYLLMTGSISPFLSEK